MVVIQEGAEEDQIRFQTIYTAIIAGLDLPEEI